MSRPSEIYFSAERIRLPLRLSLQVRARTCNLSRIIKDRTFVHCAARVHTDIQSFAPLVPQFKGIIIACGSLGAFVSSFVRPRLLYLRFRLLAPGNGKVKFFSLISLFDPTSRQFLRRPACTVGFNAKLETYVS